MSHNAYRLSRVRFVNSVLLAGKEESYYQETDHWYADQQPPAKSQCTYVIEYLPNINMVRVTNREGFSAVSPSTNLVNANEYPESMIESTSDTAHINGTDGEEVTVVRVGAISGTGEGDPEGGGYGVKSPQPRFSLPKKTQKQQPQQSPTVTTTNNKPAVKISDPNRVILKSDPVLDKQIEIDQQIAALQAQLSSLQVPQLAKPKRAGNYADNTAPPVKKTNKKKVV